MGPSSGTPVSTDGPDVETNEHLGGFAVVDVADDDEARYWGRPDRGRRRLAQEVHRLLSRGRLEADRVVRGSS